jgi:hypothetical protein
MTQNGQDYAATKVAGSVTERSSFVPTSEAERTVARAAAWLDSKVGTVAACGKVWPADWRNRIDVDRLDIHMGDRCVIGQPLGCSGAFDDIGQYGGPGQFGVHMEADAAGPEQWIVFLNHQYEDAWRAYITATRGKANTETSSDLGAKPNNPTSPPTTNTTCGQTRTRSPEVLERVTANV